MLLQPDDATGLLSSLLGSWKCSLAVVSGSGFDRRSISASLPLLYLIFTTATIMVMEEELNPSAEGICHLLEITKLEFQCRFI